MNETLAIKRGPLLAVVSDPPTTPGTQELTRVELARQLLGYESVEVVNLLSIPTYRTGGISAAGLDESWWTAARPAILEGLDSAADIMLAYGCQGPSGPARQHFRN